GVWDVTLSIMGESAEGTLTLTQEGETVTGELSADGNSIEFEGTYTEGTLEMTGSIPEMGGVTLTATIEGDDMTGSLSLGPIGTADFTGKRKPGDERDERGAGK
ncbi:MAG: hypothetical protein KJN92_07670, partial [Gemmatimonadetes bacterium]|nr:hypothetical protein [Gemmatimonadota bacterium]